jgi:hypothetical protein
MLVVSAVTVDTALRVDRGSIMFGVLLPTICLAMSDGCDAGAVKLEL